MICFAVLAHDKPEVLESQIRNIRMYNPDSRIVLYNGGREPLSGEASGIPVCPYSRPLRYGRLERFLLDTARWLEEEKTDYEYLASVDSDVLFIRHGFGAFLREMLREYDLIGVNMAVQRHAGALPHWIPGEMMWKEWFMWEPFLGTDGICGTLNPMQAYTHRIVRRILDDLNRGRMDELERCLASSRVFALEELLMPTLALRAGGRPRPYPAQTAAFTRAGEYLSLPELAQARSNPGVFFVHPVRRDLQDAVWSSIIEGDQLPFGFPE